MYKLVFQILFLCVFVISCKEKIILKEYNIPIDHHVHILSPQLIKDWKNLGVPFSKPDSAYSSISYILSKIKTEKVFLLSMAYLYGSQDFSIVDEYENVKRENNYVNEQAEIFNDRCAAFFSINPLKDYAEIEVVRCIDSLNMDGIKLHLNNSGVNLRNIEHRNKLFAVLKIANDKKFPVMLHLHNGNENFGAEETDIFIDSVLTKLPGIELYIAHFGNSGGYNTKSEEVLNEFIKYFKTAEVLKQKIYFDISAVLLTEDIENIAALNGEDINKLSKKIKEIGLKRIVLGSDYPVFSTQEYVNTLKVNLKLSEVEFDSLINNSGELTRNLFG